MSTLLFPRVNRLLLVANGCFPKIWRKSVVQDSSRGHFYIILCFSISLDISPLSNGFTLICHTIIAELALHLASQQGAEIVYFTCTCDILTIFLPLATAKLALLPNWDFSCSLRQVREINTRLYCPLLLDDNKSDWITCPHSTVVEGRVYFELQTETQKSLQMKSFLGSFWIKWYQSLCFSTSLTHLFICSSRSR